MKTPAPEFPPRRPFRALLPVLAPLLLTAFVYRDVADFAFVNFDDDLYVEDNRHVTEGLSPAAVGWALTTGHAGVWIPATWLSFQLDAALFGAGAGGFHRTNLLLHLLNLVLVYCLVVRLTGAKQAAVLAAALFGVHPINVEAVAWVTARKDVLMGAFLFGSLLVGLSAEGRRRRIAAGALAVAAMAAKPAAVIAPLLLLLAARRQGWSTAGTRRRWGPDLAAAASLLAVAAAVSFATVKLAYVEGISEKIKLPLVQRVGDAVVGVFRYLQRLAWPENLTARYPEADLRAALAPAVLAGVALLVLTAAAVRWRQRAPLPAFGWLWYLICLIPSIGLVQGGQLPMADRYVYVAAVGLWTLLAAAAWRWAAPTRGRRAALLAAGLALVSATAYAAQRQVEVWRDPETFWRHALSVTKNNEVAHQNLGVVLDGRGRPEEALQHLEAALAIRPLSEIHFNAGNVCAKLDRAEDAEQHYRSALRLNPDLAEASINFGSLLGSQGRLAEARDVLLAAEARRPDLASLKYNLAVVDWLQGDPAAARTRCLRALELDPGHVGARDLVARIDAGSKSASGP